ncbi:MAG TPA: helix-turn-helix domain-containing protein [Pirellulales bacterium]|nr:helix-turn-helix domain-containing protein [Pirellulales bacterium]
MKLLLVTEVAEILRCSESTVYNLLESGKLLGRRCPGWRIKPDDLEAYVEGTKREPRAPPKRDRGSVQLKHLKI